MKQWIATGMLVLMSSVAGAQQPGSTGPAAQPGSTAPAAQPGSAPPGTTAYGPNLRFEISIADEGGGGPATKKTVAVIARPNNQTASVRSNGTLNAAHPLSVAARATSIGIGLSVDVRGLYDNGKIPARVTVDYQPYWPEAKSLPSSVRAQVDLVFDEGRRTLISQAADPLSDRRTTIEVTVTTVK